VEGTVVAVDADTLVYGAVGLIAALWITASAMVRAGKRRDAERATRFRRIVRR
jgi:hypothetical protein